MVLRTRLSLGSVFAASAVLATILAWHAQRQPAPPLVGEPIPAAQVVPAVATEEPQQLWESAQVREDGEEPGPATPSATIDKLDLDWLPAGYVHDVGHDKTAELAQFVETWAVGKSDYPRIEYRKGVVFVRSAEDRGDEGPYPRSASPQDQRVCSDASTWLRDSLGERLANEALTCDKNVCSYSGGEYAPDGYLVFREINVDGEHEWALDAWVEVYRAALSSETIAQNEADVVRALRHELGTSCAGEPRGAY